MSSSKPTSRNGKHSNGQPNASRDSAEVSSDADLLEQVEMLRHSLREALAATNTLTAGLKRQRQRSKRLRTAMASLKQLQAIDS